MQPIKRWAPLLALALVAINSGALVAVHPAVYEPYPQTLFRSVEGAPKPPRLHISTAAPRLGIALGVDESLARELTPTPIPRRNARAAPRPKPRAEPRAKPRAASRPVAIRTSRGIMGKASWYCKAGVSACHHSYPPGSMVAAACAPLRSAMGNWRGRFVRVSGNGHSVVVKLVDWCGSSDKTIDLYAAPFNVLGDTRQGVLRVTVRW